MQIMRKQIMTAPHNITFEDVPVPEYGPGQVLLKIKRIGICGSDIHVFHGEHPYVTYPLTQGHEVSAQVVAVGDDVENISVGQKATIEPQVVCGQCHPCRNGKYNLCESLKVMGFQTTGTASDYFVADAAKVTTFADNISYDKGAMIEPLAVTVHAVKRAGDVKDKKVVVMGAGPIGILLIQTLKAFGAAEVMATDISDFRLALAAKCGADHVYNTRTANFGEAIVESFGKDKADIIYDCAGNDIVMNQAIQNARKGSTIVLVAVFAKIANIDLAKLNDSELDLNTSMMYRHEDYVEAIRILEEGKVELKPLMSKHFAFEDYQEAYEYIDNNRESTMKVIIDIDPDD